MTVRFGISVQYLCDLRLFRWRDIAWGVNRSLLSYADVVSFGLCRVDVGSSEAEFELAGLDPRNEWAIDPVLQKLVTEEGNEDDDSAARWVFALLLHAFESARTTEELFQFVDDIYCDFDHPEVMYEFVSWTPALDSYDVRRHTFEQNRRRRLLLMFDYLSRRAATFGARAPARVDLPV